MRVSRLKWVGLLLLAACAPELPDVPTAGSEVAFDKGMVRAVNGPPPVHVALLPLDELQAHYRVVDDLDDLLHEASTHETHGAVGGAQEPLLFAPALPIFFVAGVEGAQVVVLVTGLFTGAAVAYLGSLTSLGGDPGGPDVDVLGDIDTILEIDRSVDRAQWSEASHAADSQEGRRYWSILGPTLSLMGDAVQQNADSVTDEQRASCDDSDLPPLVLVHGNGKPLWHVAVDPASPRSLVQALSEAGYGDCIFEVRWLTEGERRDPFGNHHTMERASIIAAFVEGVRRGTGKERVDVVGHSLGATMAMHGLERWGLWAFVRRFLAVGAGLRGMAACRSLGPSNPGATLCSGQSLLSPGSFGFHPNDLLGLYPVNPRMGSSLVGLRNWPGAFSSTAFYAIGAGLWDQLYCSNVSSADGCEDVAFFTPSPNVRSQVSVGYGTPASAVQILDDRHPSGLSPSHVGGLFETFLQTFAADNIDLYGADLDGVGHVNSTTHTNQIHVNMLTTDCVGQACCGGPHAAHCQAVDPL